MKDRLKYKLNGLTSKEAQNNDTYVNVDLSGEQKLIPPGEINHVLNVGEQFDKERNESDVYRFTFTVSPIFSNVLSNISGSIVKEFGDNIGTNGLGLISFSSPIFLEDPYDNDFTGEIELSFKESIDRHLKEVDGWFGFWDPDVTKFGVNKFYELEPNKTRFDLNSRKYDNWDIALTYPAETETHRLVEGGLLINDTKEVIIGKRPMLAIGTSTYHGLETGDRVRIKNSNLLDGTYQVVRLGLDDGTYMLNYFCIDVDQTLQQNISSNSRMVKVVNGEESTYYVRKYKKILLDDNDYEVYPLAFSKNIFNDQNFQIVINEDVDLTGLKDNLGRPLSEVFLTMIKTDSNGMFTPTSCGFDLEYTEANVNDIELSNTRLVHEGNSPTPNVALNNDVKVTDDSFWGDIVEYNRFTLKETVLSDVMFRFNTNNRATSGGLSNANGYVGGPRTEGYIYNPHFRVKLRDFSIYIEQGDDFTVGIPDYAENLGDGRYLWRDLLSVGAWNGADGTLDYPFTNGCHYIHDNICLMTQRQDPFGNYSLYYGGKSSDNDYDPRDPFGDEITDKFRVNNSGDAC